MKQWKLLVAFAMLLAFVAGAVIGVGRGRMDHGGRGGADLPGGGPPELRFSDELGLSADQRNQIRQVWEAMIDEAPRLDEHRREVEQHYRDAALTLLTPEQRQKYDAMVAESDQALQKLDDDRHAKFRAAIEKTQALLTPEQREKFEQIMSRHHGPGDFGGPGGFPHHGGPHGGPGDFQSGLLGPEPHGPGPFGGHGPPPPSWSNHPSTVP